MADVSIDASAVTVMLRFFRTAERELRPYVREASKEAGELVAEHARGLVPSRSGRFAASIKVRAYITGAAIAGGSGFPDRRFGWLDFGGNRRKRGGASGRRAQSARNLRTGARGSERAYIDDGRYMIPALKARQAQALDIYRKRLLEVLTRAAG